MPNPVRKVVASELHNWQPEIIEADELCTCVALPITAQAIRYSGAADIVPAINEMMGRYYVLRRDGPNRQAHIYSMFDMSNVLITVNPSNVIVKLPNGNIVVLTLVQFTALFELAP